MFTNSFYKIGQYVHKVSLAINPVRLIIISMGAGFMQCLISLIACTSIQLCPEVGFVTKKSSEESCDVTVKCLVS